LKSFIIFKRILVNSDEDAKRKKLNALEQQKSKVRFY
jgi:hypothetical protein